MNDVLKKIILQKEREVAHLYAEALTFSSDRTSFKSLKKALSAPKSIIAEIKRASPAKGALSDIPDPVVLAKQYQQAGAAAISVLTDSAFFHGSVADLQAVSIAMKETSCVVLRKEFIIDVIQLMEAVQYGADAVLIIVAVLQDRTQVMIDEAHALGLEVLLEVHTADELSLALKTNADVIGINNRNLSTLDVDVQTSLDLISAVPDGFIKVSESGIHDPATASRLYDAGFNALLVGEALVTSENPAKLIKAMRGAK